MGAIFMSRRMIIAAAIAVLGLAAGLVFTAVHPLGYASTTTVLLARSTSIQDDAAIAAANRVRLLAQRRLGLAHPIGGDDIRAQPLASSVIGISVQASSPRSAQAEANAVARAYLNVRADLFRAERALHSIGAAAEAQAVHDSAVLRPAQPGQAVYPFTAFAVTGLLGLAIGAVIALLLLGIGGIPGGRRKLKAATA
jgi:capsular polysaccharide biosynthesis protein